SNLGTSATTTTLLGTFSTMLSLTTEAKSSTGQTGGNQPSFRLFSSSFVSASTANYVKLTLCYQTNQDKQCSLSSSKEDIWYRKGDKVKMIRGEETGTVLSFDGEFVSVKWASDRADVYSPDE